MTQTLDKNTGLMKEEQTLKAPLNIKPSGPYLSSVPLDPSGQPLDYADWSMIDKPIIPVGGYEALRTERKDSQNTLGAIGNGIASALISIPFKLGQGASAIGGLGYWGIRAGLDEDYSLNAQTFTDVYDNAVMNFFAAGEEKVKEVFPIYYDQQYESDRFLDRLGTAKFWAGDAMDGLAYLASSYITGGVGNMLGRGLATGMAKGFTKAGIKGFASQAGSIGARAAKLNNIMGLTSATALNTISEAAVEAHDVKGQVYDLALEVYGDEKIAMDLATRAAANTFTMNSIMLIAPNLYQSKLFFKKYDDANDILTAVRRGILDPKNYTLGKEIMKDTFKSALSEGLWEEGMQNAIQNVEKKKAFGMYDNTISDTLKGLGEQWVRGFSTQEGQNSMFIGALIGALGGSVGSYKTNSAKIKQFNDAKDTVAKLKNLESITNGTFIDAMKAKYKTTEKGIFEFNDKGDLIVNEDWVGERAKDLLNDVEYETEKTLARLNNDPVKEGIVDGFYYSRKLYNQLTSPMYETSDEAYDAMVTGLEGDLNTLFDMETDEGKAKSKEFKEKVLPVMQQLKQTFDDINKSYKTEYTNRPQYDGVVNNKLKQMLFYVASKNQILSNSLKDPNLTDQAKEEVQQLIQEGDEMIKTLSKRGKERTKYVEDFLALENKKETYQKRVAEIDQELNKTEKDKDGKLVPIAIDPVKKQELEQEKRKMQYELAKDLHINGVSELERLAPDIVSTDPAQNKRLNFSTIRGSKLKVLEKAGEITKFRAETDQKLDSIETQFEEINTELKNLVNEIADKKSTFSQAVSYDSEIEFTQEELSDLFTELQRLIEQYNEKLNEFNEVIKQAIELIHEFDDRMKRDPDNFSEEDLDKFKRLQSIIQGQLNEKIKGIQNAHKEAFDNLFVLAQSQGLTLEKVKELEKELNTNTNPAILNSYNVFINDYNNVETQLNNALRVGVLLDHIYNQNLDWFLDNVSEEYLGSLPVDIQNLIIEYKEYLKDLQDKTKTPEELENLDNQRIALKPQISIFFYSEVLSNQETFNAFAEQWTSSKDYDEDGDEVFMFETPALNSYFEYIFDFDNYTYLFKIRELGYKFFEFSDPNIKLTELLSHENILQVLSVVEGSINTDIYNQYINNLPENTVEEYLNKQQALLNSKLLNDSIFFKEYIDTSKMLENFKTEIGRKFDELQQIAKPNSKIQQWGDLTKNERDEYLEKEFINDVYSYGYIESFYRTFKKAFDENDQVRLSNYDNLDSVNNMIDSLQSIIEGTKDQEFDNSMKQVHDDAKTMLDYLINTIAPEVRKNQQDRSRAQEKSVAWNNIAKWNNLGIIVEYDINTQTYNYSLTPTGSTLKNYIGEDAFNKLLKEGVENGFDVVVYEKFISAIKTLDKDVLDKIKQDLKEQIDEIKNNSKNHLRKDSIGIDGKPSKISMPLAVNNYLSNPDYFYELFTLDMIPQNYIKTKEFYTSPIFNYTQHRSLSELYFEMSNYVDSPGSTVHADNFKKQFGLDFKDFMDALEYHLEYSSLLELESELENENDYLEYNKKLKDLISKESITLNRQQEIALYELYKWYKRGDQQYSYLQGIAGTGKTTVVLNYFSKLMNIPTDKIVGTAHNESAVNTLYDVINPTATKDNKFTLSQLLQDITKLQSLDLIVVDEILANDNTSINTLIKAIKIEQKRRADNKLKPLKILLMGDPNQITNLKNFTIFGAWSLEGILPQLKIVPPLTIAYRSDVGSINLFSNSFQNKTFKIEGLQAIHSEEFTNGKALGVYVMKQGETKRDGKGLLEDVKLRLKSTNDNGRTKKVIIVSNSEDLTNYADYIASNGIENTTVMMYQDVQGMTFDEVFVDIKEKDIPKDNTKNEYDNQHHLNTIYYTALSRSKSYTMFFDETGTMFNKKDNTVVENNVQAIKEKQDLKDHMTNLVNYRLTSLGEKVTATFAGEGMTEEEVEENPQEEGIAPDEQIIDEPTDTVEEEEEGTSEYPPVEDHTEPADSEESVTNNKPEGEPITPTENTDSGTGSVVHTVNAPTHHLLKPDANGVTKAKVETQVKYVFVYKRNPDGTREKGVAAYSKRSSATDVNDEEVYDLLTITLAKNLNPKIEFERKILEEINKANDNQFKIDYKDSLLPTEINENNFVSLEGEIKYVRNLSFVYNKKAQGATHVGKGLTSFLTERLLPFVTINEGTANSLQYGTIKNIEYKIFSQKELNSEVRKNSAFPLQLKDSGKPFAVVTFDSGGKEKTLYVRLDPAIMSKDNKFMQTILSVNEASSFISNELSALGLNTSLGDNLFNELTTLFRKNYEFKDGIIQKKAVPYFTKDDEKAREEIRKVLENNDQDVIQVDSLTNSLIDLFNKDEVVPLYKGVYTGKQTLKRTSAIGYSEFIRKEIEAGNIKEEDAASILNMVDSYHVYNATDISDTAELEGVPFRKAELKVLMQKTNGIDHANIFAYYNKMGLSMDQLPNPATSKKDGYDYTKYANNGGFTHFRIKQLRYYLAKQSYVKITNGPNTGKYYAFDPLTGKIKVIDKMHEKGYVSSSALKQAGIEYYNLKDEGLSKSGSPLEKALVIISRNNKTIQQSGVSLRNSFTTKDGETKYTAPSILNYDAANEKTFNSGVYSKLRKLWREYINDVKKQVALSGQPIPDSLAEKFKNATYIHHETGLATPLLYQDFKGRKNLDALYGLSDSVDLESEEALNALLTLMQEVGLKDGDKPINLDYLKELNEQPENVKPRSTLTGEDLNYLSQLNGDRSSHLRTPIDKLYLQTLSEKANPWKQENRTAEENSALEELETLFETHFSKLNTTVVQIETNWQSDVKPEENITSSETATNDEINDTNIVEPEVAPIEENEIKEEFKIDEELNEQISIEELPSLEEDLQEVWKTFDSIPALTKHKNMYILSLPSQIQAIADAVISNNDILDNDLIKSVPAISEFNKLYKLPEFKSILDKIIANEIIRLKNPNENSNDPINRGGC